MPRIIRSKTVALPAVADEPLAKHSNTTSTIPAKRVPDDSANKEGEAFSAILPNTKRVAFSDKTNLPDKSNPEHERNVSKLQKLRSIAVQNDNVASGEAPNWAWDVCGKWEVRAARSADYHVLHEELDVTEGGKGPMYLTIRSSVTPQQKRQMWAEIEFGTLQGIIRFCPSPTEDPKGWPEEIPDFEKACEFDGCWPGPSPMGQAYWHTRRRGSVPRTGLNEKADDMQTDCTLSKDKDGRLLLSSLLIFSHRIISIKGFKLDEQPSPAQSSDTLSEQWENYKYDPDQVTLPCADDGPWDVTGEWNIHSEDLGHTFGVPQPQFCNIIMNIQCTEDTRDNKAGKQLWATFTIGSFEGIMRFCPYSPPQSLQQRSLESFEESCFLGADVHVGKRMKGNRTWLMRWRGTYLDTGVKEHSDTRVSEFTFHRWSIGRDVHIQGSFAGEGYMIAVHASKKKNPFCLYANSQAPAPQPYSPKVHELWARHESKDKQPARSTGSVPKAICNNPALPQRLSSSISRVNAPSKSKAFSRPKAAKATTRPKAPRIVPKASSVPELVWDVCGR